MCPSFDPGSEFWETLNYNETSDVKETDLITRIYLLRIYSLVGFKFFLRPHKFLTLNVCM